MLADRLASGLLSDLLALFYAVRHWWLAEEAGPGLLLAVRILSAVGFVSAGAAWASLARATIFERTWTRLEARRFRRLVSFVSFGAFAVAAYFLTAGALEGERTSSPHRLLAGNVAFALLSVPLGFVACFLRLVFTRKAVNIAREAVEVAADRRNRQA